MGTVQWVHTMGERLAMLLTLTERSGIDRKDMSKLQRIKTDLMCEPERACIMDFTNEQAALIMRLHMTHF